MSKDKIKKFNKRKLEDLDKLERILTVGSPRFGANINELVKESDNVIRLAKGFIYYYRMLEVLSINLKKYKDDEDTLQNIYEMIEENYNSYMEAVNLITEHLHN